MKIEITAGGIYDSAGNELEVGTELTVSKEPLGWVGRYRIISAEAEEAEFVTNELTERHTILKAAALQLEDSDFTAAGTPDVGKVNAKVGEGVPFFSAAERDALWPDIVDAYNAEREAE